MNNVNLVTFSADEVSVSSSELAARLRLPPDDVQDEAQKAIDKIKSLSEIKCAYAEREFSFIDGRSIAFDFGSVSSTALAKFLEPCEKCVFFAATLGMGVERYLSGIGDISVTEIYFADAVASAFIEGVCDRLQEIVEESVGETRGRFSPGYGDLPISFQRPLLQSVDAGRRLGISLTESMLMIPRKSVSGIIGVKNVQKE